MLSHAELDAADDLDDGDPADLAERYVALRGALPTLAILGGCCGTDIRHVTSICDAWLQPRRPRRGVAEGDHARVLEGEEVGSSASGKVENFAITMRAGRWMRIDWPFIPRAA